MHAIVPFLYALFSFILYLFMYINHTPLVFRCIILLSLNETLKNLFYF